MLDWKKPRECWLNPLSYKWKKTMKPVFLRIMEISAMEDGITLILMDI